MTDALLQGRPARGLGHYLRDIVYGANDGAVTTLAVVAGVAGATLAPSVALILGAANLIGDGVSMAAANYLSLKSDLLQRGFAPRLEMPLRHAGATLLAFVLAGGLPLGAYLIAPSPSLGLMLASVAALAVMAIVGAWRASFVHETRLRSAVEAVLIGGAAAVSAYAVGWGAKAFVGGT